MHEKLKQDDFRGRVAFVGETLGPLFLQDPVYLCRRNPSADTFMVEWCAGGFAMKYEQEQEVLRFSFEGEFDNLSVMRIKDESIALIERFRPKVLKLDFADVTFVDSSGIGYVLARYQQLRKWQGEVVLCNLTRLNQTIFEMSGIFQIIRYEKSEGRK